MTLTAACSPRSVSARYTMPDTAATDFMARMRWVTPDHQTLAPAN